MPDIFTVLAGQKLYRVTLLETEAGSREKVDERPTLNAQVKRSREAKEQRIRGIEEQRFSGQGAWSGEREDERPTPMNLRKKRPLNWLKLP